VELATDSVRFAKGTADFLSEDEPEDGVCAVGQWKRVFDQVLPLFQVFQVYQVFQVFQVFHLCHIR
jgi:hypothetical protein